MAARRPAASKPASADDSAHLLVGHVQGAWGVRGEVKVVPQSADAAALLSTTHWQFVRPHGRERDGSPGESIVRSVKARRHGTGIVARVDGVDDRDAAQALTGTEVHVERAAFPRTADDEYYWVDLIGCRVVNRQGEALGAVAGLIDTGVHSVLRIASPEVDAVERLVPFVAAYVDDVDLAARTIRVDWQRDY